MSKLFTVNNRLNIPVELYTIKEIMDGLSGLRKDKLISDYKVIRNVNKAAIRRMKYEENSRFFTYIKFCNMDDDIYGLVGGKTNFTSPDVDFSKDYGDSKTSYARKFLEHNRKEWDTTIILIEHLPTNDAKSDEECALYTECYLQRKYNLFDS